MILLIGVLLGATVLALAVSEMALTTERAFQRELEKTQAEWAFQATASEAIDACNRDAITLPATYSASSGGAACTSTVSSNDTTLSHTYRVTGNSTIGGRTYGFVRIIPAKQSPHPVFYAMWAGQDVDSNLGILTTLGGQSSVYAGDDIQPSTIVPCTISGDAIAKDQIASIVVASGDELPGSDTQPWPSFSNGDYSSLPSTPVAAAALSGHGFAAVSPTDPYPLLYRSGDLDLSGTFSGKGTIYVTGNVTVTGNVSYANADARLVVIAKGDIQFNSSVSSCVGTLISDKAMAFNRVGFMTMNPGNLICHDTLSMNQCSITVTAERAFWTNRNEAVRHYIPGFHPSPSTSLMR